MNIPLDYLYHYIEQISQEIFNDRVIIYRFWPHGSKNIANLETLSESTWAKEMISPSIHCWDQEPLLYSVGEQPDGEFLRLLKTEGLYIESPSIPIMNNIYIKTLLLHSEKRSNVLDRYLEGNIIPVYYWSHAIIARDWFRYAEHAKQKKQSKKIFLIYNRAWAGTREYRLKFMEHLINSGLSNKCQSSVNPVEPELGIHYKSHKFENPAWRPNTELENFFPINTAPSHYSADFNIRDYEATDIEVVLETLFDDNRLHLTEKSLRPIACGQPFILAGTHGSLEYLQSYGFKTFDTVWNESYDQIKDPAERLQSINDLMWCIANWTPDVRERKMAKAQDIAEYNQQYFFSQKFFDLVIKELKRNLTFGFDELKDCDNYTSCLDRWNILLSNTKVREYLENNQDVANPTMAGVNFVIQSARDKLSHNRYHSN